MTWLITLGSTALACAGMFHDEGTVAESEAAVVLLEADGDQTHITYAVRYTGDAQAFGWLIPVPGPVSSVADGDGDLLHHLGYLSQPHVTVVEPTIEARSGCGSSSKGDAEEEWDGTAAGYDNAVMTEGFTGTYDYVVLDASDPGALQAWFDAEGWSQGQRADDIATYTGDGRTFVALTLRPSEEGTAELPPIAITADTTELSFPSVMARHAPDPQRTTVYVSGDTRAEIVAGWSFEDREEVAGAADADPLDVFEGELAEMGREGAWLRTWSSDWEDAYITRFDLLAEPAQHQADAVFGFDGSQEEIRTTLWLEGPGGQALLWVGLLGLGGLARRRSRG